MSTLKVDTIATRSGSGNITASNTIVGNVTGNLTGNVTGNVTGNLTGNSTIGGTLGVTGLITATGGVSIGSGGDTNVIDDYEEGAWVPTIKHEANTALTVGYNSSYNHARYVKIGTIVFFQFTISLSSVSGGASNQQLILNNMPFTAKTYQTNSNGGAFMHYQSNVNTAFTYGIMLGNQANLRFYSAPNTPSYGNTLTSSSYFQGYGQYETAS